MAMVRAAFIMCGVLCISGQYIYPKEKNRCARNGEAMMQIRELLIQQGRVQESVDSLGKMVKGLEQDVTKTYEDFKIVKEGLKLKHVDCQDLFMYITGYKQSGVYTIYPFDNETRFKVFCDMETEGGGWTAIQRRLSGSIGFNRTWAEYKKGFGNVFDSYWIGNDMIHQLTKGKNSSLYISITLRNGTTLYEHYQEFSVSNESDNYRLFLGGPATGTLGDRMLDTGDFSADLSGMAFSTLDRDHDRFYDNCAVCCGGGGGWWYNGCYYANLNGKWSPEHWHAPWDPPLKYGSDITETLMMIKPH
ncbi:microfibril-associated glycoprotein 4-like [Saccostrea cucullata]|uniref:microfibril-associated glycoprotein 4-like n=1 Tax=Saccostrea cuccullata TaxID=36930 RepID=UPI002ED51784